MSNLKLRRVFVGVKLFSDVPVAEFYDPSGMYTSRGIEYITRFNLESLLTRMENLRKLPHFKPEIIEEEAKALDAILREMAKINRP